MRVGGGGEYFLISRTLGVPIGTAKTRMRRALEQLRMTLARHDPATEGRRTS